MNLVKPVTEIEMADLLSMAKPSKYFSDIVRRLAFQRNNVSPFLKAAAHYEKLPKDQRFINHCTDKRFYQDNSFDYIPGTREVQGMVPEGVITSQGRYCEQYNMTWTWDQLQRQKITWGDGSLVVE